MNYEFIESWGCFHKGHVAGNLLTLNACISATGATGATSWPLSLALFKASTQWRRQMVDEWDGLYVGWLNGIPNQKTIPLIQPIHWVYHGIVGWVNGYLFNHTLKY